MLEYAAFMVLLISSFACGILLVRPMHAQSYRERERRGSIDAMHNDHERSWSIKERMPRAPRTLASLVESSVALQPCCSTFHRSTSRIISRFEVQSIHSIDPIDPIQSIRSDPIHDIDRMN